MSLDEMISFKSQDRQLICQSRQVSDLVPGLEAGRKAGRRTEELAKENGGSFIAEPLGLKSRVGQMSWTTISPRYVAMGFLAVKQMHKVRTEDGELVAFIHGAQRLSQSGSQLHLFTSD